MGTKLTEDQIKNWRRVIFLILEEKHEGAGAYSSIMPIEEIEEFRNLLQKNINDGKQKSNATQKNKS